MNKNSKSRFLPYLLGALQLFIGLTAIAGGLRLVANPSGTLEFPLEWLNNTPFTTYIIPGLILLIVIGVSSVLAGIVTFLRSRYTGNIAVVLGAFLILYMIIEVWLIGLRTLLQPLYFILGVIELIIGLKLSELVKIVHQIWIESTMSKLST